MQWYKEQRSKGNINCMYGLKGSPQAVKIVFLTVNIVHQIRNWKKYIALKDKKAFMKDLKEVYKVTIEEIALARLDNLKETHGNSYGMVVGS